MKLSPFVWVQCKRRAPLLSMTTGGHSCNLIFSCHKTTPPGSKKRTWLTMMTTSFPGALCLLIAIQKSIWFTFSVVPNWITQSIVTLNNRLLLIKWILTIHAGVPCSFCLCSSCMSIISSLSKMEHRYGHMHALTSLTIAPLYLNGVNYLIWRMCPRWYSCSVT